MFFPHGMAPGYWEPKDEGKLPEKLPYILESLERYKDQTTVFTGLWSQSAEPPEGTTGSDHWVAAAYLTGIKPRKTAGSDATVGSATIDQMIASKIGQESLLPSLQLAVEDPNSSSSNCGEGDLLGSDSIGGIISVRELPDIRALPAATECRKRWVAARRSRAQPACRPGGTAAFAAAMPPSY